MGGARRDERGGSLGLLELIEQHGEAVEADLSRYHHGLRLSEVTTGGLSWRRLGVLVRALPRESATARSVHGDATTWSVGDYLLAGVFDVLAWANYQRAQGKGTKPTPIERPGSRTSDEQRVGTTTLPLNEMKELAQRWMAGELEGR